MTLKATSARMPGVSPSGDPMDNGDEPHPPTPRRQGTVKYHMRVGAERAGTAKIESRRPSLAELQAMQAVETRRREVRAKREKTRLDSVRRHRDG